MSWSDLIWIAGVPYWGWGTRYTALLGEGGCMVGIGEGFYRVFIHAGVGPAGPPARALRKKSVRGIQICGSGRMFMRRRKEGCLRWAGRCVCSDIRWGPETGRREAQDMWYCAFVLLCFTDEPGELGFYRTVGMRWCGWWCRRCHLRLFYVRIEVISCVAMKRQMRWWWW